MADPKAGATASTAAASRARSPKAHQAHPAPRTTNNRKARNVACAIGNSNDVALAPAAERLLNDNSPLVRGMAVWALRRLLDAEAFQRLKSRWAPREADASAAEEWDA